jgi:hypothetical protein
MGFRSFLPWFDSRQDWVHWWLFVTATVLMVSTVVLLAVVGVVTLVD